MKSTPEIALSIASCANLLATLRCKLNRQGYPSHLSNRLETNSYGTVTRTFGHLPFGETWYETGTPDKWKFTGYERDTSESGLDYAMNRMYSSGYGRFQMPDLLEGTPWDPQSLNRYPYVGGDPSNFIDPSGLDQHPVAYVPPDPDLRSYEFDLLQMFFNQIDQQFQNPQSDLGPILVPFAKVGLEPGSVQQQFFHEIDFLPDLGAETSLFLDSLVPNCDQCHYGTPDFYAVPRQYGEGGPRGWPTRLFGTHWCGAGGGGPTMNNLDEGCKAHDQCFDAIGLSAAANTGGGLISLDQATAAQKCNEALYAVAAANPQDPGSSRIMWWLSIGDYVGTLAPGTAVRK